MVSYHVAGSNIFGQWPGSSYIINEFHVVKESKHESDISFQQSKLHQINWSYNILEIDKELYISGAWNGKENQLVKVELPNYDKLSNEQFLVAGNDNKIIVVSKHDKVLWVIDIKMEKEVKKISFNIEEPIESAVKKAKKNSVICKVMLTNDSCLYLTSLGNVYSGILPTYVDTSHCKGKVCDIKCGYEHFILLTDTGSVYTWGNGRRLQLGHGNVDSTEIPTELEALAGIRIIKINAGGWHSLALSEFGDVYAWGWNDTGQLGIKCNKESQESYSVPTIVDLFYNNGEEVTLNIKDISCGSRHSAILLEDNTVWTTGCNKYGQLGFSEEKYPIVNCFKKAFDCNNRNSYMLMCGAWTTVIISS